MAGKEVGPDEPSVSTLAVTPRLAPAGGKPPWCSGRVRQDPLAEAPVSVPDLPCAVLTSAADLHPLRNDVPRFAASIRVLGGFSYPNTPRASILR